MEEIKDGNDEAEKRQGKPYRNSFHRGNVGCDENRDGTTGRSYPNCPAGGTPAKVLDGKTQQTVTNSGNIVGNLTEVIEIDTPIQAVRKVDYLSLLELISQLGTKHFLGSSNQIEGNEWRARFVRNFWSTLSLKDYKKYSVHFLEGDAHN